MSSTEEWPAGFDPRTAPVYARNEIRTTLTAEQLWPALVTATRWPEWYPDARRVSIIGGGEVLTASSHFTWTTLGVRVKTQVTEFEPARRLAWSGSGPGSKGYHRWILAPAADSSCLVVTEEVQIGLVPRLVAGRLRRSLHANHQRWIEGLVDVSRPA
jgi:Polyketide cyclase / dehydrase and lipid transport